MAKRVVGAWLLLFVSACRGGPAATTSASPTGASTASPALATASAALSTASAALSPGEVDLAGYSRACKTAADCRLVHRFPCDHCGCPKEAIANSERERYDTAAHAIDCQKYRDERVCGECMPYTATCDAGTCGSKGP